MAPARLAWPRPSWHLRLPSWMAGIRRTPSCTQDPCVELKPLKGGKFPAPLGICAPHGSSSLVHRALILDVKSTRLPGPAVGSS